MRDFCNEDDIQKLFKRILELNKGELNADEVAVKKPEKRIAKTPAALHPSADVETALEEVTVSESEPLVSKVVLK